MCQRWLDLTHFWLIVGVQMIRSGVRGIAAVSRIRLVVLYALLVAVPNANAQNIIEAPLIGQPLVYMNAGKLSGCGIRLMIVDTPPSPHEKARVPVWDLSFNLYLPGRAIVKIGSYDVSVSDIKSGKMREKLAITAAPAGGWLKAPDSDATVPLDKIQKSDDPGFILYSADASVVMALFNAQMKRAPILVGTRRVGANTDRVFSGTVELSDAEQSQSVQCMKELLGALPR